MSYSLININKKYGDLEVLSNFTLEISEGKITCILGPSGCGKTTLLNIIAGITEIDSGQLKDFTGKKISYVFQSPRLLPWKTVGGNIEFILKDVIPKTEIKGRIEEYLKTVDLLESINNYPGELSGGMKQRLALARAFAFPSDILLLDEPLKSLDLELKLRMIDYILKLWKEDRRTIVLVTHDINAAITLGHEIVLLSKKPCSLVKKIINHHEQKSSLEHIIMGHFKTEMTL